MARRMQVVFVDDVDGSEAVESLAFTVDGVAYEIDLNADHAAQFRDALAPWIGVARRVGGRRATGGGQAGSSSELAAIRAWAREQGLQVADRGRISAEVRQAYNAAH